MASGLTPQQLAAYQSSSNPWEWNQWAQTQDPGLYGWKGQPITADNLKQAEPYLRQAGMWRPEYDGAANTADVFGGGDDGGYTPGMAGNGADLSGLNGYSVGTARSSGYNILDGVYGANGQAIGGSVRSNKNNGGMHAADYATMAAVLAGGYGMGAGFGAMGVGAGVSAGAGAGAGTLGTIGAGAGEVGAMGTVGQFAMPELGALAAPTATLAGETAGLTAGQVGALGGTGAVSAGGTGVMGSGSSLATTGIGSSALPATGYATGSTLPALRSTMGTVSAAGGAGLGEYAAAIKAGTSLVGGLGSAYAVGKAGQEASQLQQQAAQAGQAQLAPYAQAGTNSLKAQQDLAGLNGPEAQKAAIAALQGSPEFTAKQDLGERSILANASATGGLRGGNTQASLAQFSPALLSQLISEQYGRLGSMTNTGLSAAGGVSNLIQQGGAAAAGGAMAGGRQQAGYWGALGNAAGFYAGLKGW